MNWRDKRTVGAILAGGQSSRMGQDKALLPLRGQPMIGQTAKMMQTVFDHVCVVSDRSASYQFLDLPIIPDLVKNAGPMGGIHAALRTYHPENVFVIGCDTPFISGALIRHILLMGQGASACMPKLDGYIHHLCGYYSHTCLAEIELNTSSGRLKLLDFLDVINARTVDISTNLPFYSPDLLRNFNEPSTYQSLSRECYRGALSKQTL